MVKVLFGEQSTNKTKLREENLGLLLDPDLNLESHISNLIKTAFYHHRKIATISLPGRY